MFGATAIMHCSCAVFIIGTIGQSAEKLHTSPAVPLYAEKTSLYVACLERSAAGAMHPFHLSDSSRWSQAVSMEHLKAKPRRSVTYLAGEVEALAKRKGKTSHTHKSHGCGFGGWFSLINRKRDRERQSWRRAAHTGEGYNKEEFWKQVWVSKPILLMGAFLFLLHHFNLFHRHHPSAQGSEHKGQRSLRYKAKTAIKRNKKRDCTQTQKHVS